MLSINTNLQSYTVQQNLNLSTNALNKAIERMTTGYKLNHASDNAAGYSIAQTMTSKLSSYDVAASNISAGLDLVKTAQDTISLMQSHGERIHALITQAQNGTYGASSLEAINSEVGARIAEITRLYQTTEYNGISLFGGGVQLPDWAEELKTSLAPKENGFIDDIVTVTPGVTVTDPTQLASAISSNSKIGIGNAATLRKLAELVNSGTTCQGKTIILTDDIDLNNEEWTAIGTPAKQFKGTFDGQGHKIKNLKIDKEGVDYQGLFGYAGSGSALKNVGLENVNIKGRDKTGGLAGEAFGAITNSYATGSVTGGGYTGGLAGGANGAIKNSYATGSVTGSGNYTGGLAGSASGAITNSYATGNVTGGNMTGGLAGQAFRAITNSYATGSVTGTDWVGGLVGQLNKSSGTLNYDKILSSGTVTGDSKVGSLIGGIVNTSNGTSFSTINITNASAASQGDMIGFEGKSDGTAYTSGQMDGWLENITAISSGGGDTTLQVGINGDESCQITFGTGLSVDLSSLTSGGAEGAGAYTTINEFLNSLSARATELGAVSNRLESSLESTTVEMENLTSSLSTIRDADIAKESSAYIRQQILQQAAATLLATANQTPAIALQLL